MSEELNLIVTVSYAGAIGYAELYECRIKEKIVGTLEENQIRLTVLTSDKDKLSFLSSHLHPQEIELGLRMVRKKEPYRLAPISGFVDKRNTSWEIRYMREAQR